MARSFTRSITLWAAALVLAAGGTLVQADDKAADQTTAQTADKTIDAFVKSVEANQDLSDDVRQEVLKVVETTRTSPDTRSTTLTEALRVMHPAFRDALVALGEEETGPAIEQLAKLSKSDDSYLATEASYFLARARMMEEQFEEAVPVLKDLNSEEHASRLLYGDQALFLLGIAQAGLLQRKEATASLEKFVKDYPQAPERMVVGALTRIEELKLIKEGSIIDVEDRMDFSRRKLDLEDSGDRTQEEQTRIIAMLDKLIKEAEEKECQCQGGGAGQGGGQGRGGGTGGANAGGPASQSGLREGSATEDANTRVNRGSADDAWGKLKEKDREKVLSALKARFPDRYEQLVKQYYENLQKGSK